MYGRMQMKVHVYLSSGLDRSGLIHAPADLPLGKPPIPIVYQVEWVQRQYGSGSSCKQLYLLGYFGSLIAITTRTSITTVMIMLLMMMKACAVDATTQLSRSVKKSTPEALIRHALCTRNYWYADIVKVISKLGVCQQSQKILGNQLQYL